MGHNIRNFVMAQGEPLQFGIEDGKLEEFLSNRGFKNIHNVSSDDYKKLYCRGKNVNREVCDLSILCSCRSWIKLKFGIVFLLYPTGC